MKNLYAIKIHANRNLIQLVLLTVMLLGASLFSYSQVRVPFTPRTSDYTPGQTVYSIKGDFTMVGNTNLTLVNYTDTRNNSSNDMKFVDVDADLTTNNSSSSTLVFSEENGAIQSCSNIVFAGLYWTGRSNSNNFTDLQRRTIKFKGPGQSYQTLVADANDLRYPGDGGMFAGYKEVTTEVRNGGIGDYFVADIALSEGDGGSTGYYGGWGMVVVYENTKMDWRDVTVFDGYAYVAGGFANHTLDVSGFKSVQHGDVDFKLGMMAGEGDVSISGDYFQMLKQSDNQYQSLSHTGNTATNFFNSSIDTGGNNRNVNLQNNTGLDIAMFEVPNPNNSIIGNNQTSTQFRYGSNQDTYIIFNITFSVDAFIPESEGLLSANTVNGNPTPMPLIVQPGDTIEYGVEIRNKGTEAIENARLVVPIPYTSQFVPGSINYNVYNPLFQSSPPYYAPNEGATGAIVWDIPNMPLPADINELLADITFELSSTTDCTILINNNCSPKIVIVGGYISGTGEESEIDYSLPLIQGYQENGVCQGEPNTDPIEIDIDSEQYIIDNCTGVSVTREFFYCDFTGNSIPVSEVAGNFPPGTEFFDSYPVTDSSIQYDINNPFPATLGVSTYYAVPQGNSGCSYIFTIEINDITTTPTVSNVTYCLNETALPLTATATNPDYVLLYYIDNNPTTNGQIAITPSTTVAGTFTYYVSEGPSNSCVGERTPITVTVLDEITITLESLTPNTCNVNDMGAIDISVSGGTGDYTYLWNDTANSTTQDLSGLPVGSYTVTVNDVNSNCTATATYEIITEDTSVPTISAPAGFSTEGCSAADVTIGNLTALVYSETQVTITEAEFLAEGGTFIEDNVASITYQDTSSGTCLITVNRTFTITNICDASATDTQIITINAPAVIANAPTNVSATACNYENQAQLDNAFNTWLEGFNVSGGCNVTADYGTPTSPILCEGGTTTVTYTITDACDPFSIERTFSVSPPEALTIITEASNISIQCDGTGDNTAIEAWLASNGDAVVSDSCSEVTWTNNYGGITPDCSDPISVTFTATDACGSSVNTSATYSIIDTVAPVITAAITETVECDGSGNSLALEAWLTNNGGATATDDCSAITWTHNFTSLSDDCGETGTASVTFTATDGCGNESFTTASFTIIDTIAPVAPDAPANITVECIISDIPAPIELTALDNCSGEVIGVVSDITDNTNPCNAIITRTWTFTDACNNSSSVSQIITEVDTVAPVAPAAPADMTYVCISDIPLPAELIAMDNCAGEIMGVVSEITDETNPCNITVTRTWTFTDSCNNSSSVSQIITVADTVAPVPPSAPSDITYECIDDVPAPGDLTAVDNCAGNITVTGVDITNDTDPCNISVIRTWTFADACNNSSSVSQTITVSDTTPPTFDGTNNPVCVSELINGSFEANTFNGTHVQFPQDQVPGWSTTSPHGTLELQRNGQIDGSVPHSGNYHYELNGRGLDNIYQEFCSLPSSQLEITFYHKKRPGSSVVDVLELYAGNDLNNLTLLGTFQVNINEGWKENIVNYTVPSNHNSTIIFFKAISGSTNSVGNLLDDISVSSNNNSYGPMPTDVTVECTAIPEVPNITASDNCGEATVIFTESQNPGSCANEYTIVRTWTASDTCGNSISHTQNITVQDTTAPGFVQEPPHDITVECDAIPDAPVLTATDNCGEATVTFAESSTTGTCPTSEIIERIWTATDACGNETIITQLITVVDTIAPEVPDAPADITYECISEVPDANDLTATDACSGDITATATESTDSTDPCNVIITRTWTFTDTCNNSASVTQTITVADTIAPIAPDAPADITYECVDEVPAPGDLVAIDNCAGEITATGVDVMDDSDPCNLTIIRTWSFDDSCNNTVSVSQTITVSDTTPPEFSGVNNPVCVAEIINGTFEANTFNGEHIQFPQDQVPGWSTTSPHGTLEIQRNGQIDGSIPHSGNYHFELNGRNLDDLYQEFCTLPSSELEITFYHKKRPGSSVVDVLELYAGNDLNNLTLLGTFQVSAEEDWKENIVNYTVPNNHNSTIILFQAVSGSSNSVGNLLDDISVSSNNNSYGPLPTDITVECTDIPAIQDLTATDNCGEATVIFTETQTPGACDNEYTIIRTWTASDTCGNSISHTQNITVQDTTAPGFVQEPPHDITVECDAIPDAPELTATDNCGDATVEFTESTTAGNCPTLEVIERTWTATDACGNETIITQVITVVDTVAPIAPEAPADITLECISSDIPVAVELTATDSCSGDIVGVVSESTDNSNPCNIIITRTWTFTDTCNNSSSVSQIITIADTMAPVAPSAPDDITYECVTDVPVAIELMALDNCAGNVLGVVSDITDDSNACNITITRTWTFTDACDNSSSVSQTITIADTIAPVAPSAPADITYECVTDVPVASELIALDNCAGNVVGVLSEMTDDSNTCNITITRTWTFTDACDNSSSVSQTIRVIDTTAPVVTNNLSDITVNCDVIPEAPTLVFEDCSSNVTISYFNEDNSYDGTNNNYEIIWTWEFADACGNIGTTSQIVYVTMSDNVQMVDDNRCSDDGTIDLFDYYNGTDTSGAWVVVSGQTSLDGNYFDPSDVSLGNYVFSYTVASNGCLSTTEVTITVNDDCVVLPCGSDDVVISKAITPNGDQWNEYFEVTGIETCGFVIDVKIFNRWGAMIYESGDYQNNWNGTVSKASIGNANNVPAGTYYYILNLKNSGLQPITGYVYIGTK